MQSLITVMIVMINAGAVLKIAALLIGIVYDRDSQDGNIKIIKNIVKFMISADIVISFVYMLLSNYFKL